MSGTDGNLLEEKPDNCHVLRINNPILTSLDMLKIRNMKKPGFKVHTVSILCYKNTSFEKALDQLLQLRGPGIPGWATTS